MLPSERSFALAKRSNYAFKPIAEQSLRPNQTIVPQRLNAALDFFGGAEEGCASYAHQQGS